MCYNIGMSGILFLFTQSSAVSSNNVSFLQGEVNESFHRYRCFSSCTTLFHVALRYVSSKQRTLIMGKVKQSIIAEQESRQLQFDFDAPKPKPLNQTQMVAKNWVRYAEVNRISPKSKKYMELQHAYLCGIGLMLGEDMPMLISLCMQAGRDVASVVERTQPR